MQTDSKTKHQVPRVSGQGTQTKVCLLHTHTQTHINAGVRWGEPTRWGPSSLALQSRALPRAEGQ